MSGSNFVPSPEIRAAVDAAIEDYNARRAPMHRKVWRDTWIYMGVLALVGLVGAAILWPRPGLSLPDEVYFFAIGILVVAGFLAYGHAHGPGKDMQQELRDQILPRIFGFAGNVRYGHREEPSFLKSIPQEAIGVHNRSNFDDLVSGTYHGMDFELSEMTLEYNMSSKSRRIVFKGVVLSFPVDRPFPGTLVAVRADGPVEKFFRNLFSRTRLAQAKSGIPQLDETYDFRTDNPEAAAPRISGNLAKALDLLRDFLPGEPARIAVVQNSAFLLIPHTKNFFELPGLGVPLDYGAHVEPIAAELTVLLESARLVRSAFDSHAEEAA